MENVANKQNIRSEELETEFKREGEAKAGEIAITQFLAKRYSLPIEKVRSLMVATANLLEMMLRELSDEEQVKPEKQEKEETAEERKQALIENVKGIFYAYSKRFQHEVLTRRLAQISDTTDKADRLIEMESKVKNIYENLDIRIKALITILMEIEALDGEGLGVKYGNEIFNKILHDENHVAEALRKYPGDKDLNFMVEPYKLAKFINENADN